MAQSATDAQKTPRNFDAFWEKAIITPPFMGEMDATMEIEMVGKRRNRIEDGSQRITYGCHSSYI